MKKINLKSFFKKTLNKKLKINYMKEINEKKIQYSPLQSNYAKRTLNMDETSDIDTVIVKQGDKVFKESEAAFIILKFLNHPLQYLRFVIPRFLADKIYNLVSRKRYSWFGKKEKCIFPNENSQFLIK